MTDAPGDLVRYVAPRDVQHLTVQLGPEERQVLDTINRKVAAAESLDDVMNFVFEATERIFPCDRVSIALLEDSERRVTSRWVRAHYQPVLLDSGYSEGTAAGTLRRVLQSGSTRLIGDLAEYVRLNPDSHASLLLLQEGSRSSMTCPLRVEGRSVGFLFRNSRRPYAYDDYQVMLHNQLAERLSQSVEKAWRIDQLTAANQGYLEMLGFASHELKSPLSSIIMQADLLLNGYVGPLSEQQRRHVESMSRKAAELLDTTKDYLDLARLEGGRFKMSVEDYTLVRDRLLAPVLDTLAPQIAEKAMTVETAVTETAHIQCDAGLMKTVCLNLVGNAVKYGRNGGRIRISGEHRGKSFRLAVWNEGAGFPPEERSKLFKRFSRLAVHEHKHTKGSGVGLYIVWQIIQLHGGRVHAHSQYGEWAEFVWEIPQPLREDQAGDLS